MKFARLEATIDISLENVEADEIWGFVGKKEGHEEGEKNNTKLGDACTFVGIEARSKLVVCFELGRQDLPTATTFMQKMHRAAEKRFQLTTDGLQSCRGAAHKVFGDESNFAQLVKSYRSDETENRLLGALDCVITVDYPAGTTRSVTGESEVETLS